MSDENEAAQVAQVEEWSDVAAPLAAKRTDEVLAEVKRQRGRDDEREGYFRDFRDAAPDCVTLLPSREQDTHAVRLANTGSRAWLAQLAVLWGWVARAAMKGGVSGSAELRVCLVRVLALCVAWVEAIDERHSLARAQVAPMPWWRRVLAWLQGLAR